MTINDTFFAAAGVGHGNFLGAPANLLDEFQRIFAWFDRWGDISRDADGDMIFENGRVKSRGGQPALAPDDYARFPVFGPGGDTDPAAAATRAKANQQ